MRMSWEFESTSLNPAERAGLELGAAVWVAGCCGGAWCKGLGSGFAEGAETLKFEGGGKACGLCRLSTGS